MQPAIKETEPFKIAYIDIETRPLIGYTWRTWDTNIIALVKEWGLLSFAVKWNDSKKVDVYALPDFGLYKTDPENDLELAKKLWEVFNDADLIVAHNGDKFDNKKAAARFIFHNLPPPTPYKSVDTLKVARKYFAFTSNKLGELAEYLGIGAKEKTGGFDLWLGCMKGDKKSWELMKKYNQKDVVLLEKVYDRFKGWHTTHPNINMKENPHEYKCPSCGSIKVQSRGWDYMKAFRSKRYQCINCSRWSKGEREKIPGKLLA